MIVAPPEWQLQPGQRRVSETAATHDARTRGQPCHPELSLPPLLFSTSSSVTLQKHAPSLLCELLASAPLRTTSHRVVHCDGWPPVRTNCCRTKPRACLHAFGPTHFLTTSRTKVVHSLRLLLDTLLPPLEALPARGSPYPALFAATCVQLLPYSTAASGSVRLKYGPTMVCASRFETCHATWTDAGTRP